MLLSGRKETMMIPKYLVASLWKPYDAIIHELLSMRVNDRRA